jgi:hypothetical protein
MQQSPRLWSRLAAIVLLPVIVMVMLPVIVLFAAAFYLATVLQALRVVITVPFRRGVQPEEPARRPHFLEQAPPSTLSPHTDQG